MKNYIFDKNFEEIFTNERIHFEAVKLKIDIDIKNFFDFAPHKTFLIPKNSNELREISIPDNKTKIIQKILHDELSSVLRFSDRSYAYQKNKSPLKAINRVKHIAKNFRFIIKSDIDDFFDRIDHVVLIEKLQKIIKDNKIIYLITIFLKNGTLFKGEWVDKFEGIYQGDVLSPLLSNIYLHSFDIFLQKNGIEFVRFADDLIFFSNEFEEAKHILKRVKKYLKKLHLSLNDDKTSISHISKPFIYLGVKIDLTNNRYSIENERLMEKISKLYKNTQNLSLEESIKKINEFIQGFSNYYLKIINDTKQFNILQENIENIIIDKIIYSKEKKLITQKTKFLSVLQNLLFISKEAKNPYEIIQIAYEKLKLKKPLKEAKKEIEKKKNLFLKNSLKTSELIISKTATHLSYYQGQIKISTKGEIPQKIPFHKIKRIIILNKSTSISTYLIYKCAQNKIDIDFIEENEPYALLTYYKTISKELHLKQLKLSVSPKGLIYSKALHYSKAKNQVNLLKYYNLRRNNQEIKERISKMQEFIKKIKSAKNSKTLMAIEGQISQQYWNSFKVIIDRPSFQRIHQHATDAINQALNYGYAILYNKIQSALIKEGLNIYYSFLHTTDYKKPTLVFDMIEPFRQPIVDREIVSIITKKQTLKTDGKLLTKESKKVVIQNIQERLATQTKTKYGKTTYLNLINFEVNNLKRAIELNLDKIQFFIAKY